MTSTAKMAHMAMAQRELIFQLRGYFPSSEYGVVIESDNHLRLALSLREVTPYNLLNHVNIQLNFENTTITPCGRLLRPLKPILLQIERLKQALDNSPLHRLLAQRLYDTQRIDYHCHVVMNYDVRGEEVTAVGIVDRNMNRLPLHFWPVTLTCALTKNMHGGNLFANRLNLLLTSLYTRAEWLVVQDEAEL